MTLGKTASKGAKWTALQSGVTAVIGIAQISVLARFLAPADFGAVAVVMVVLEVSNVFVSVGFSDVLVVRHDATVAQLSTMYWLNVLVGVLAYSVVYVLAPMLGLVVVHPAIQSMARILGLTLVVGSLVVQFRALLLRELQLKELAVMTVGGQLCGFVTAVSLAVLGFGVWSLVGAGLVSQGVTGAMLLTYATRKAWLPKFLFEFGGIMEMVRFGSYRIAAALLNTINVRADQMAIGSFLGARPLGLYSVAYSTAMQPFNRINPILTQVSFPVFAKIRNDDAQLLRAYRKGVRLLVAVNSPLLFGLIAVAPILMPALLGPGWDDSVAVVRILSIVVLLRSANNINVGLILAKEKYRWPMYLNLVLLVLVPSTIFVAAGLSHSLVVVSWAIVVVQGCVSVGVYVMFVRRLLGGLGLAYLGDVGRPIIAGALMAGVLVWLQAEVDELQGWPGLLVLVPLGGVVYGAVSLVIQRQHMRELFAVARGYA